ncbi:TPA: hypothetical protein DCZ32_04700 [Candidatus Uhrbacteria bacterium]|nr:hypothetical protein [Candidatus Uhrbacteria bacterium]
MEYNKDDIEKAVRKILRDARDAVSARMAIRIMHSQELPHDISIVVEPRVNFRRKIRTAHFVLAHKSDKLAPIHISITIEV